VTSLYPPDSHRGVSERCSSPRAIRIATANQ